MIFGIFSDALTNVAGRPRRQLRVRFVGHYVTVTCDLLLMSANISSAQNP